MAQPSDLVVRLDSTLPGSLPVGRGSALFCNGACFHRDQRLSGLELLVDERRVRPTAWRMPRLDLHHVLAPEPRRYRSGFWATIPLPASERPGSIRLRVAARLQSGAELIAPLGEIPVVEPRRRPSRPGLSPSTVVICMATFEPDMELFRAQVESLRNQTIDDWLCVVSDDCSSPGHFEEIERTLAGDARFELSRAPRRLGPYRNFERALELVPEEAKLVALCDQDDRWYPDKLATLRTALGSAQLVYSDQRLVDRRGQVLRSTLWEGRRNNSSNLASLLIANTVTGAASLFRRELADLALPFPDIPGWQFHDHWIALVALASGDVAYVNRPLYDYVQHPGAIIGQLAEPPPRGRLSLPRGWRSDYFYAYVARDVQAQALLTRCGGQLSAPKRRTLERFAAAARKPLPAAWLATRPLRALTGANETLGSELQLVRGILWRYLIELRTGRRETPDGSPYDAACPPLDSDNLGGSRLARWRAGHR